MTEQSRFEHTSSTVAVPTAQERAVPTHVAIILDGNGRWATQRMLPRTAGHVKGVEAVRATVKACVERGIEYLTLFAFSSENWRRPAEEVSLLMGLFITALDREVSKLHANGVRLKVVGDLSRFEPKLQQAIVQAQELTQDNRRLTLTICANYGGRWDIMNATRQALLINPVLQADPSLLTEEHITPHLAMAYAPEPDLFIRTGGEQRVSNFLLWQLAYSELYFTPQYWPDFDAASLDQAITSYAQRERRFGRTSAQVAAQHAKNAA